MIGYNHIYDSYVCAGALGDSLGSFFERTWLECRWPEKIQFTIEVGNE